MKLPKPALVFLAVVAGLLLVWSLWYPAAVRPGGVVDAARLVPSYTAVTGSVFAPVVFVEAPASWMTVVRCWVDDTCTLTKTYVDEVEEEYDYASAGAAATLVAGNPVEVANPSAVLVKGPSAALAAALTASAAATSTTLPEGIAATGVVAADGSVGPVAYVPVKIAAADDAGMKVLLVPQGLAPNNPGGVEVVEVSSLADAWAEVCQRGGRGALCEGPR